MFVASTYMKKEMFSESEPDLAIFHASELVTMSSVFGAPRIGEDMSELAIIQDGAIAIRDERIIFVGTTDDLFSRFALEKIGTTIDASNNLVTPGFIDPHTHLIFDGTRENEFPMKLLGKSYIEILREGGGILRTVQETRKATLEKLVENGKKILDRMLLHGTTTVEVKSGYGLTTQSEIKLLKAAEILDKEHPVDVIATFLGAHAIPVEYENRTDNYVNLIITEMIPKIVEENLAEFCDVFCEEGIFSLEQTRLLLNTAKRYGLKPLVHVDEIKDTNGAKLAAEINAIQAGHLLRSNEQGLKALAESEVIATLLPGTPFSLMLKDYAPARRMIDLGIKYSQET